MSGRPQANSKERNPGSGWEPWGEARPGLRNHPSLAGLRISACTLLLMLPGCLDSEKPTPTGAEQYVGRATCAPCHPAENQLWSGSDHDLAMQEAGPESVLGDFDTTVTIQGVTSTFYQREGRYFVRTPGPQGLPADYPIAYTFGVEPLQQYLAAFPGGRFQVLNLAWDSRPLEQGGQRWFYLYPQANLDSNHPLYWTRPSQTWNNACSECHSTHLVKGYDPASNGYQTTWSEIDVSCEACHGPASGHVELARRVSRGEISQPADWGLRGATRDRQRSWSLRPEATTSRRDQPRPNDREIEICAPCHARRSTIAEGHQPGQPLFDAFQVSLLRPDLYFPDGQIQDEVYVYGSFLQSRMYREGVTCSDCHDPHSLQLRVEGNGLCAQCHLAAHFDSPSHHHHTAGTAGSQCVECHMPSRTYMEVDDRRDHGLRVPEPGLAGSMGSPNPCNGCHQDRSPTWAVAALESWYGPQKTSHNRYAEAIQAGRNRNPAGVALLTRAARDPEVPAIARGTALALLGSYHRAESLAVLSEGLRNPGPLVRLGALQALQDWPPEQVLPLALPLLDDSLRAVRLEAARILAEVPRNLPTPQQLSAIERGIREYLQSQQVNSDHPGSWVNLGNSYALRGELQSAEDAYRRAVALDPTFLPGLLNLADFLRRTDRDEEAESILREGLRMLPDRAELEHALGLLLVRKGDGAAALALLKNAAASDPDNPRFAYVYAVGLASGGRLDEAFPVLENALAKHPYDPDLLAALATFHRDLGSRDAARRYAQRLLETRPHDPEVQQLLRELEPEG